MRQTTPTHNQTISGDHNIQVAGHHNTVYKINQLWQGGEYRARRNRQKMLQLVKNTWIKDVLERSLYRETLIELGLEDRSGAVHCPWDIQLRLNDHSDRSLPLGTRLSEITDKLNGSLLILGEPGAGKTTMLLELARDLIARAEQDPSCPMPVVFNLSSWSSSESSIADWLVTELITKYNIPQRVARPWVEQDDLFLLLDGLDEVNIAHREMCVKAINGFRHDHGLAPLVVCSRTSDYDELSTRLSLRGAVVLQPLTRQQIGDYFERVGSELSGLHAALQRNTFLQELAQQPLMLSIMVLGYRDNRVDDSTLQLDTVEGWREHLFDTYVERMFSRVARTRHELYSSNQTLRWLAWLAQKMIEQSQTVFVLDSLESDWLPTRRQQRLCTFISEFFVRAVGAISFGTAGLAFGIERWGMLGALTGAAAGAIAGWWIFGVLADADPSEGLRWSWMEGLKGMIGGLIAAVVFGVLSGRVNQLVSGVIGGIAGAFVFEGVKVTRHGSKRSLKFTPVRAFIGVIAGWFIAITLWGRGVSFPDSYVFGSLAAMIFGLNNKSLQSKPQPNQVLRQSATNATAVAFISGMTLLIFFSNWQSPLLVASWFWLSYGGNFVIRHSTLRLFLYKNAYAPLKYARFLDFAADRIFLRKTGSGYVFIHRMLMEYFAQREFDEKGASALAHRANSYRLIGKYDQALTDFDSAIRLDNNYAWAITRRGITYLELGRYREALGDFDVAVRLNKKSAWTITLRGKTYLQMEMYDEALADFDRAIKLNSDYAWPRLCRAETHELMGEYAAALMDCDRLIAIDEQYAPAIVRRALIIRTLGRYGEALAELDHAIAIDRKLVLPVRAETCRRFGYYEQAINDFTEAIALEPKDTFSLSRRAATYFAIEKKAFGCDDLLKAKELLANTPLEFYDRAIVMVLDNQHEQAIDILRHGIEFNPSMRVYASTDNLLDPLRVNPKFQQLMKKHRGS